MVRGSPLPQPITTLMRSATTAGTHSAVRPARGEYQLAYRHSGRLVDVATTIARPPLHLRFANDSQRTSDGLKSLSFVVRHIGTLSHPVNGLDSRNKRSIVPLPLRCGYEAVTYATAGLLPTQKKLDLYSDLGNNLLEKNAP